MGLPGGGRSEITPRLLRHFNVFALTPFDDSTMTAIYSTILKWFFKTRQYSEEVALLESKLTQATLMMYRKVETDLRPTPSKPHYTFNLRDFAKII